MELAVLIVAWLAISIAIYLFLSKARPHLLFGWRSPLKTDITIKPRKENHFDSFHQVAVIEIYIGEE